MLPFYFDRIVTEHALGCATSLIRAERACRLSELRNQLEGVDVTLGPLSHCERADQRNAFDLCSWEPHRHNAACHPQLPRSNLKFSSLAAPLLAAAVDRARQAQADGRVGNKARSPTESLRSAS